MGKFESKCPLCYHKLPAPQDLLTPYDEELNYFMWMPGFEWRPKIEAIGDEDGHGKKRRTRREKVIRKRWVPRKRGPDEPPLAEGEEEEMVEEEYEDYTDVEISDSEDDYEDDEDMQEAKEEIIEYNEKKTRFAAKASGGYMSTQEAAVLAREFGMSPSYRDVELFEEKHGKSVDFNLFSTQFQESLAHPEDKFENFRSVFAYFDSDSSGKLSHKQMQNILCTFGEPLSDAEYQALAAKFFKDPTGIDYVEFCKLLLIVEVP